MPDRFKYEPLYHASSFRVLVVFGVPDKDTPARCWLLHRDLTSPPEYHAISYTWEGQLPSEEIEVDGATMLVTANCHAALRRFRPKTPDEHCVLWIDSICIDQSERATAERNAQVGLMGEIYSKAQFVLVFLDHSCMEDEPSHRRAFEWLQSFADLELIENEQARSRRSAELFSSIRASYLLTFFRATPWFHRLWTLQEVALARESYLCWEELMLDYARLVNATTNNATTYNFDDEVQEQDVAIRNVLNSMTTNMWYADAVRKGSLAPGAIMELPSSLHASRPHDKVYGIYGLLETTGVKLPVPDYTTPVEEVYWQCTVALLKAARPSHLLDAVNNLAGSCPSWVRDWSILSSPDSVAVRRHGRLRPSFDVTFERCCKRLLVKGIIVDTLQERARGSFTTGAQGSDPWNETDIYKFGQSCSECLELITSHDHWNLVVLREFLVLLLEQPIGEDHEAHLESICGTLWSRQMYPPAKRGHFWRMLEKLSGLDTDEQRNTEEPEEADAHYQPTSARVQAMKVALQLQGTAAPLQTEIAEQILLFQLKPFYKAFVSVTERSRYQTVFRTQAGRVGMAPHPIRPGDKIFMFVGSEAPAVVRPVGGGRYRWVAQAYVHGLMEHDILPEHEDELEYVTFE